MPENEKFAIDHVKGAINSCFYGEMTIKFENGKVVLLKKEQCFKPKN